MNLGAHPCVAVGKKHHNCRAPGGAAPVVSGSRNVASAAHGFGRARLLLRGR